MMATFASDPNLDAYLPPGAAPATTDRPRAESRGALGWLDDRLGLSAIRYAVPEHANTLWYTLGGITFVGILVLVATGAWLGQYYNPDPTGARESVIFIQNEVPLGDVIRGIHVWTAYLVVITAALHLLRVFVTASYKVPREINWLVGEAMVHNMEAVTLLGGLGGFFSHAFTTSVSMLARLYVAHVSIIPLAILLLLIVHLFLIKHHGISPTPAQAEAGEAPGGRLPKEKQLGHYPSHLRLMVGYGLALLGLAGMLGVVFPQPVGPAPDPTLEVTKPPFVFYWLYPFEDWFGVSGIVYAGAIVFGLLAILPFADRSSRYRLRRRPLVAIVGLAMLVMILVLSIMTAIAPTARHLS
jgi:quinol-cytochrome oxidoreductase complex cytochrome b subunit